MRGIDVLRRHGVQFNVLCVLGPHNVGQPRELMRFYRDQGFSHVQFIPCMDFQAMEPEKPFHVVAPPGGRLELVARPPHLAILLLIQAAFAAVASLLFLNYSRPPAPPQTVGAAGRG